MVLAGCMGTGPDRASDSPGAAGPTPEATDPAAANELWTRIDHEMVDRAVLVPLLNPNAFDFVSKRVHNYQYNEAIGALRDQLWVR